MARKRNIRRQMKFQDGRLPGMPGGSNPKKKTWPAHFHPEPTNTMKSWWSLTQPFRSYVMIQTRTHTQPTVEYHQFGTERRHPLNREVSSWQRCSLREVPLKFNSRLPQQVVRVIKWQLIMYTYTDNLILYRCTATWLLDTLSIMFDWNLLFCVVAFLQFWQFKWVLSLLCKNVSICSTEPFLQLHLGLFFIILS
jgi:hypothetical protein